MSDPSKTSPFSFSQAASSSGSGSTFSGQTSSGGLKVQGNIFGTNNSTAPTKSGFFASTPTTSGTFSFSQGPSASQTSLTGGNGSTFAGGGLGTGQNQSLSSQLPANNVSSVFSSSSNSKGDQTNTQNQKTNLFGALGGSDNAGTSNSNTFSFSQAEASTPISKPVAANTFPSSTTPIGPPPSNNEVGVKSSSLFNALGSHNATQSTMQTPNSTSNSTPFLTTVSSPKSESNTSIFNKSANSSGTGILSMSATSDGGIFSNLNKPKENVALKPSSNSGTTQQTQPSATTSSSLFPSLAGGTSGATPNTQTSSNTLFSGPSQNSSTGTSKTSIFPTSFSTPAYSQASTAPTNTSIFSMTLDGRGMNSASAASSTAASNLGASKNTIMNPSEDTKITGKTSGQQLSPVSEAKPSGLGQLTSSAPTKPQTQAVTDNAGSSNPILGASMTGPAPNPQSRLKNKSMDEIITRWATDLSKYQKEFQKQAEQVSAWDRMLVENSEKIQRLYGSTLEAERAMTEVERQLTAVENDQEELTTWLDQYEKEVDSMMSAQVVQGESLQGPDQERERT